MNFETTCDEDGNKETAAAGSIDWSKSNGCKGIDTKYVEYFDDAGADFSDYSSPSSPDVTVSTTEELENAVSNGNDEKILVESGTYTHTGGLKIEDADTLVAENAPDSSDSSTIEGGIATLTTSGVTIKGFNINGGIPLWESNCEVSSNIISTDGVGIGLYGSNNLVRNNKISGSGDPEDAGIHIQASGNTVEYNTIKDFTKGEAEYYTHGKKGAGIYIYTGTGVDNITVERNTVKDNTIGVMVSSGSDQDSPTNVVVNTNNIEGNVDYGVFNMKLPSGDYNYWEYEKYTPADATVDANDNYWGTDGISTSGDVDATWKLKTNSVELSPSEDDTYGFINEFDEALEPVTYTITSKIVPQ